MNKITHLYNPKVEVYGFKISKQEFQKSEFSKQNFVWNNTLYRYHNSVGLSSYRHEKNWNEKYWYWDGEKIR